MNPNMRRRVIGWLLILVGATLIIVGQQAWHRQNAPTDAGSQFSDSGFDSFDMPTGSALGPSATGPDRTVPLALLVLGGAGVLTGVGVLTGLFGRLIPAGSGRRRSSPEPLHGPALSTELGELARLHATGALADDEYERAKAKLLGNEPAASVST